MKEFIVIGDIAGEYDTLMALLKKCPDVIPVSLGDMIDRGPKSKDVLEFFMNNGKAIFANHEHLMLDWIDSDGNGFGYYDAGIWGGMINGAHATLDSFNIPMFDASGPRRLKEENKELISWIGSNPKYIQGEGYILSHAPINPTLTLEQVCDFGKNANDIKCERSIIWNRGTPRKRKDEFQVHGHMANKAIGIYAKNEENWGVNIDTSRGKKLTAMHWPSTEMFEQEFI